MNQIQILKTHNSYRAELSSYIKPFYNLFINDEEKTKYTYEHATITEQLISGLRGLEFDLLPDGDTFYMSHIPTFDYRSTAPDFRLALEELKLWSERNPDHIPVTILMEPKTLWYYYWINPTLEKWQSDDVKRLNDMVLEVMGRENLITPNDIIGSYANLGEAVANDNWLYLSEAKGKFVFLLHPDENVTPMFLDLDPTLRTLSLFPTFGKNGTETNPEQAAYILYNNPELEGIQDLVSKGYIVRTRVDENMVIDPVRRQTAFDSGAQILSTDLVKGRLKPVSDYFVLFDDKYTIRLNFLADRE
jgi:hypothetical protein